MSRLRRAKKHSAFTGHAAGLVKPVFKLKHKHAKPLRKRHILSLSLFAILATATALESIRAITTVYDGQMNASLAVQDQVDPVIAQPKLAAILSNYGFTISVDPKLVKVTASETAGGQTKTYDVTASTQIRGFNTIQINPLQRAVATSQSSYDRSSMSVIAKDTVLSGFDVSALKSASRELVTDNSAVVTLADETKLNIGSQQFQKFTYNVTPKAPSKGRLKLEATNSYVYATVLGSGKPVFITLKDVTPAISPTDLYDSITSTFSASLNTASTRQTSNRTVSVRSTSTLVKIAEKFGVFGRPTSAKTLSLHDNSRVIATNAPAVVKVYHIVCGSIEYYKQPLMADSCDGDAGSGFFLSSDGYIATNGHVVNTSAKDIIAKNLSNNMLARILNIEGYTQADSKNIIDKVNAEGAMESAVLSAIYRLDNSSITFVNQKDYYYVALGNDVPNIEDFIKNRTITETKSVKQATLVGSDYDPGDLIRQGKFTGSDVAILRVAGDNYPITRLGGIGELIQGMPVTVIGFPGTSDSSPITSRSNLQTTASNGIVSAIRDSNGGGKKIIQSDVKLGVGNSGGPAFSNNGQVIGIATYLYGGAEKGDAQYSYLRDVQDLKDLANDKGIVLGKVSETQQTWEDGLQDFFNAKYSAAIAKFQKVLNIYPAHAMASQYVTMAQTKIQNGEEIKDDSAPAILSGVMVAAVLGMLITAVLMMRHRVHYKVYKAALLGNVSVPFISLPASHFNLFSHHAVATVEQPSHHVAPRGPLDLDD